VSRSCRHPAGARERFEAAAKGVDRRSGRIRTQIFADDEVIAVVLQPEPVPLKTIDDQSHYGAAAALDHKVRS
jgi:hypothetical protein